MSDSLHGLACAQIVELERDLAAARERIAEINDYALTCKDRIAALEAELADIDRELYGDQTLNYNPNRVVTIQAIKKLSTTKAALAAGKEETP
jgi:hypothetical protein